MSDENYVDPFAFESHNSKLEVTFNDMPVGLVLDIRPNFDPIVKKVAKKHQREIAEQLRKGGGKMKIDFAAAERRDREKAIAHVAGWSWKEGAKGIGGQKPEFSEESLGNMLDHKIFGPVLQEQIIDETDDLDNFLAKSANS